MAPAVPAAFLQPGESFAVTALPTCFGPVSYRCTTEARWVVYDVTTPSALEVEPFYRDSDGKRRSMTARIAGSKRLTIPRR